MKMTGEDFESIKSSLAAVCIHGRILARLKRKYPELEESYTPEQFEQLELAFAELAAVSKLSEEAGI